MWVAASHIRVYATGFIVGVAISSERCFTLIFLMLSLYEHVLCFFGLCHLSSLSFALHGIVVDSNDVSFVFEYIHIYMEHIHLNVYKRERCVSSILTYMNSCTHNSIVVYSRFGCGFVRLSKRWISVTIIHFSRTHAFTSCMNFVWNYSTRCCHFGPIFSCVSCSMVLFFVFVFFFWTLNLHTGFINKLP